ncbi:MAG TPA: hypothetical protein VFU21_30655 [Kofleriaceae bacterium]|nr:hypothetical protein [Kofleriaceae bacterium]
MVPRRGTSDYDEEAPTTLDPFSLRDSDLVVVPRAGTDAVREDLRADPDVQDALRWLDPPSNVGPPVQSPVVDPTSAPYAQVYTPLPLPQPHPGAGPYPTPVPSFVPNTGGYYLVTPMPGAQPAPMPAPAPARSPILWILLTAVVTGGGIALGWWMFAGTGRERRQAAPAKATAPATAPAPPAASPPSETQPPPPDRQPEVQPPPADKQPEPAPAAAPVTAEVVSLTPARSVAVTAPVSGAVSKLFLTRPGKVAKGAKLVEIRTEGGGGARAKKLAERVAELEELAKADPVYEEFLADARKAQRAARGQSKVTVVKAPSAGHARLEVAEGDQVAGGKQIGHVSSGGDWIVTATAKQEVQRSWTCRVALPDGKQAPCTIDKVVASAAGSDITATVRPDEAPWLEDVSQKPTLALAPP